MNTSCHIGNRIFFRVGTKKTAYEIWNGKKPKVKYFRVFGCTCCILNDWENLGKFNAKSDEGIFLGYFTTSQAYRVYNKRTKTVMESINVKIDDSITKVEMVDDKERPSSKEPTVEVEAQDIEVEVPTLEKESTPVNSRLEARSMSRTSSPLTPPEVPPPISRNDEVSTSKKPSSRVIKNHLGSNIIGSLDEGLRLRKRNYFAYMTIAPMQSSDDLSVWVEELGEHTELESMGIVKNPMIRKMKVQWDCKRPTISSLRRPVNMQKWLRQPLKR